MPTWVRLCGLACVLLVTPCFADKVVSQTGENVDFSRFQTFQWLPTKLLAKTGLLENDPTFTPLVKEAVNRELEKRGLREVADGGDLQVAVTGLSVSVPQVEALIYSAGPDPLFSAQPIQTVGRYNKQGTMVVNLIDSRTKKTAWAGMVTGALDNKPGSGAKKVGEAAAKMFKKYPAPK